jgi:hypothetical protein
MSKIALSGNASGTGTFTLASPATNTDRVLDLPDAGGTVVLDTAAQTLTNKTIHGGALTLATAVTASGTSVDFTDIPSWVKRITVSFSGLSTSGTSIPQVRLGNAGGIEATNYLGCTNQSGGGTPSSLNYSSGFSFATSWGATATAHGAVTLTLIGSNVWVATLSHGTSNSTGVYHGAGSKTLSDTLTQIRITTASGTDVFDAGTINILYEG